jgi:hypothetical protein
MRMALALIVTALQEQFSIAACARIALYTLLAFHVPLRAAITVDARFDEAEWSQATQCTDWRRTQPYALDAPRYHNDMRIVATQEGLAASFVIDQPAAERRMKPRTPRDSEQLVGDAVGLMIDFDANGQVGYEFSVGLGGGIRDGQITNQNTFDRDWDGTWQHAVRETDDQWFVELLIPWTTITMRESAASHRTIGVFATRYLFERNERYSCPGIDLEAPVFLSDFQHLQIPQYRASAGLDIVPYATLISDHVNDQIDLKAGADIQWKASSNLWLAATLNPDFGQVESDELVVDFSAIETVLTDKRPFFTENQGIFDLRTPANGQLIYTRRVGSAPDDASAGSSDIDAALKLTGTVQSLSYGAFVAQEHDYDEDVGRLFAATRLALPLSRGRVGHLATFVDRPLLRRQAVVNAIDYEFTPNDWGRVSGQVIRSDIDTAAAAQDGYETWLQADFARSSPITHTMKLLYIDRHFDMNDLGYMERNSLHQIEWDTNRRVAATGESRVTGETQRLYLVYRQNDDGERLQSRVQLSRDVHYASSWRAYEELRLVPGGIDDLLSRGNGPVKIDSRLNAYVDFASPRAGAWQYLLAGYVYQQGVKDYSAWMQLQAMWYAMEQLTVRLDLLPQWSDDWLLWQQGNLFGSYRAKRLDFDFRLDWIPSPRHELRVKWQWIGIDADPRSAFRTDVQGHLRDSDDELAPFIVNNLGFQVRYRFEFGPMSELFLVYARGGFNLLEDDPRGVGELFRDMTDVRDADQFLIKVRYRL